MHLLEAHSMKKAPLYSLALAPPDFCLFVCLFIGWWRDGCVFVGLLVRRSDKPASISWTSVVVSLTESAAIAVI
jgi:hypothetical protein